jgi:hypothetical protein
MTVECQSSWMLVFHVLGQRLLLHELNSAEVASKFEIVATFSLQVAPQTRVVLVRLATNSTLKPAVIS